MISDLVEKCGYSRAAASAKVYSGGLSIYSTINEDMQKMLDEYYADSSNFPGNTDGTPDSAAVIIDGKIMKYALKDSGKTEKWVLSEIKKSKLKDVKDVFLMTVDDSGNSKITGKGDCLR